MGLFEKQSKYCRSEPKQLTIIIVTRHKLLQNRRRGALPQNALLRIGYTAATSIVRDELRRL